MCYNPPVTYGGAPWVTDTCCSTWTERCFAATRPYPPRTFRALEKSRERGVKIGISTNRAENRAKPFLDLIKPEIVISSGGALVRCDGEIVFRAEFSPAETRRVLDLIQTVCGPETEITVDGETTHYWNFKSDPAIMGKSWTGSTYCGFAQYRGAALKLCAEITSRPFPA